jgi:High potential iron-sulfur protein
VNETWSRREALKALITATGTVAVCAGARAADDKPHLQPSDPTALALSYYEDATKVDASKYPNYKPGQLCSNCLQLTGLASEEWRPCNLFPGKLVHARGWCKVYIKKP